MALSGAALKTSPSSKILHQPPQRSPLSSTYKTEQFNRSDSETNSVTSTRTIKKSQTTDEFMSTTIQNLKTFGKRAPLHALPQPHIARTTTHKAIANISAGAGIASHPNFRQDSIRNILTSIADPFAEADEDGTSEAKQSQNYIHIRIQRTSSDTDCSIVIQSLTS